MNKIKNTQPNSVKILADLLGTHDAAQQAERVQNLINIASAPPFSVTITLDSATGRVHGVSSTLSLEAAQLVRAMATGQQWLLDRVAEAEKQKREETKPASPQATPPTI